MGSRQPITLSLVIVAVLIQICSSRVFFRRPSSYNTFMRQLTVNFEKAKVETLGDIFKRHVQQLRHTPNKQVELVFLIDSSGTVGRYYFYEEIRFVRNLLADFTVDVNATRVSVITFSSPHKIFRHIDYLTRPDDNNHKCRLLNEDIHHVDYTPGGTHTLGAFLEAEKVLKSARPDASKAIFLMTDGYSNGGDPRPVANKLKREGVKIFTFGIRDGFIWELQDMASEPKNETCYILDSFEEFEALAKRALHADLQSGTYIEQSVSKCNQLCTKEGLCCHENATCSCGTYTGKYECLCKPGYYGAGRGMAGCKLCPPGTYKNFTGLGDLDICMPCPDEHQTTPAGAVSVQQCVCKRGYRSFGDKECTVFRCPELSPPKFGYFVNNVCNNVFNAACGLRCQHGYELRGSSLRICQDDGTWSGQDAECIMKTCPSLPPPKNGHMICSSDDFSYSSVCRFTCNAGYQLVGSRKRNCLAIAHWTGIATRCREITCPPLVEIKDGTITPSSCTSREVVFGTTCQISCSSGYMLKGPHTKQCTPDGTWMSTGEGVNQCIDETPPVLDCPENVEVEANEFEDTTEVVWTAPVPVDNSGFRPVLTSDPVVTPGSRFPIGITTVSYKAEDLSQNVARCKFYIHVVDRTPPTVDRCVSPPPIVSKKEQTQVVLEQPEFSDNSGKPVELVSSHQPETLFPWGTTTVEYKAFDTSNNNSTCTVDVVVVPHLCVIPEPPANGNSTCEDGELGVLCRISCNEGFAFAVPPAEEYFCDYEDGQWMPESMFPFPDCAASQISNDIIQPATITLTGDIVCKDKLLIERIQQDLESKVEDKLSSVCENDLSCSVGSLTSICEDEEDFNKIQNIPGKKRKRRAVSEYSERAKERRGTPRKKSRIAFEFKLEGSLKGSKETGGMQSPQLSESLIKMLAAIQKEAGYGDFDLTIGNQTLKFSEISYNPDQQTYRCHEGSILVNGSCVNCPVGTFFHIGEQCEGCPVGTYQPGEGHSKCLKCPDNKSTAKSHSKSEQECLALCLPGTYSPTGLEPCETCHIGYFQPDSSAQFCHACNHGMSTHRRGTRKKEDCAEICPPGYVSETGLAPCFPCPRNSYQPKSGQMECFQCAEGGSTTHTGSTSADECIFPADSFEMQSDTGVKKGGAGQGKLAFHPCFEEICQNGGTCAVTSPTLFKCICSKGFTGTVCDTVLDLCEANPCHNGGNCLSTPGGFQCDCLKGFAGTNCEVNIDECASFPCVNKGTCVDGVNSFTCNCPAGYTGKTCSAPVNDCADGTCQNGGTCKNTPSGFKCTCSVGYSGEVCEVDIDECISAPCLNGGSCKDLPGKYSCQCKGGYTGINCQSDINECADNPCQNGASCEDLVDDYKCVCVDGYTGKKCEKALTSQYQLDFATPTTMDYAQLIIDQPMSSVTVSFWMRTSDRDHQGTPFSYAVHGEPNAFTFTDYQNVNLILNGEAVPVGLSLNDDLWHHVVITWSSVRGDWKIYVDGVLKDQGYNLSTAKPIPGKGIFVVGQEQDSFGGSFSPSETFFGSLTHLNVWDQELTLQDVEKLRFSCENFNGNIIAWPNVQAAVKGNVKSSTSSFCLDCPTPTNPPNGFVTFTQTTPGSQANYDCDSGYGIDGNPNLKCLASGHWDEPPPACPAVNCGYPGSVVNGYVLGKDYSFNKTIRINCRSGFELEGESAVLTCTEYGDWSHEKPKCVAIQCQLPELSENTVADTKAKKFPAGSTVKFTCKLGSLMQTQHDSVVCQKDGSWDRSVPSCDLQKCGIPPTIKNGQPYTSRAEYNVGDIVRYDCDRGYEFDPDVTNVRRSIACLPTGEWEPELPVCGPVKCPDPPLVHGSVTTGDGRTFLSEVSYICLPGYIPTGNGTITCDATRDWSRGNFRCNLVDCKAPPTLRHGLITPSGYTKFGAIINYQCLPGYTIVGDNARRCEENGKWSGPDPSCQPVSCGTPAEAANGQVVFRDTTYQSAAQYLCDPGYMLQGASEIICDASGLWVPEMPTCEPRPCPQPADINFGSFIVSGRFVYGASLEYNCNTGYRLRGESKLACEKDGTWSSAAPTCEQIRCPVLDNPENGKVTVAGQTFSSIAGYTCNKGFKLVGIDARTCQVDGTWSAEAPKCLSTTCAVPDQLMNGRTDYKDLSIGSIVRYSCNKGHLLDGNSIRRCLDNLDLSGEKPNCKPVNCGNVGELSNGVVTLSDRGTFFDAVATFSCNVGYTLRGAATRTCGSDARWTGQNPYCAPVECFKVSSFISNGRANSTSSLFGSVVGYTCNEGYRVSGSAVRKCGSDGNWDEPIPTCVEVECPPPKIAFGFVSSFLRKFGTKITFSCRENYRLKGPSERTCLEDGQWSGEEPECHKIKCEVPEKVPNSKSTVLNETAISYECDVGYVLTGKPVRVCGQDEVWRPDAPSCQIVTCDDMSSALLDNGHVNYTSNKFGDFVSYECDTGYNLRGLAKRECLSSGKWDETQPICEIVSCGHPGVLLNGNVHEGNHTFNSTVEFSCNPGYKLIGVTSLLCKSDGSWEGAFPSCERVFCPTLSPVIPNGNVLVSALTVAGTAEYTCKTGFQLVGDAIRECLQTGQWSGKEPLCADVFCSPPAPIQNAIMEGDKFGFGDEIFYNCSEGYHLSGHFVRVCQQNGSWSNAPPECLPVTCPEPTWTENGQFLGESGTFKSVITYECDDGYELVGSYERICQANATWSGTDPECRRISCGTPPTINNTVIDQTDNLLFEAKVVYSCIEGYTQSGLDTTECLSNRSWSFFDYSCTVKSCPSFTDNDVPHSVFNVTAFTYRSTASFSCQEGYLLVGSSQIICTSQGVWNASLPVCQIVQCNKLTSLPHGQVLVSSNDFGSTASFKCDIGYAIVGAEVIECLSSGQWNESQPVCQIISCTPPPSSIPNGQLSNPRSDYFYKNTASYNCDSGYELSGHNLLTCLETGSFDIPPPACIRIPCPPPDNIEYGNFTTFKNDTVVYECWEGFEMIGKPALECMLGGNWSRLAPLCQPVVCPKPQDLENGRVEGNEFTFGRNITYHCDPGFQLEGKSVHVCLSNRSWSEQIPSCVPISCGKPSEEFKNGIILGYFIYGEGAEYMCDPGFEVEGDSFRLCQVDGTWSGVPPVCKRLNCSAPDDIQNGLIVGNSYSYEDSVTYSCVEGYELKGESVRKCESSLIWSGSDPWCEKISCGQPIVPINGAITGDSYLYGDQTNISCVSGYKLTGNEHRICESNGVWSGNETVCDQIFCSLPPLVEGTTNNVSVGVDLYPVHSVIAYDCGAGHIMNGTGRKTCEPTGEWSENYLDCYPVSCSRVENITHGTVNGDSYSYLSVLEITCNQGFQLVGNSSLQCTENGSWSSEIPYCSVIVCPSILIENGKFFINSNETSGISITRDVLIYGDIVTFECDEGFEVHGSLKSQCQLDGTWSVTNTTCTLVKCSEPSGIEHAVLSKSHLTFGSTLTVSCATGYDLIGESELTCGADGNWEEPLPKCALLACGSPPVVPHAVIVGDSFKQGQTITYKCRAGFDLVGNSLVTCGDNNAWLGSLPKCVDVDCGKPPEFPSSTATVHKTTFRSKVEVKCNKGYILQGNATLLCSADRSWKHDPKLSCAPVDCGKPPSLLHSSFSVASTTLGSVAIYSCNKGHFMAGGSSLVCDEDGSWVYDYPICSPMDCLEPPSVDHATYTSNGTQYLSVITYSCNEGYTHRNTNRTSIVCGDMGTWQGIMPVCIILNCGAPPPVQHASYVLDGNRTDYLSNAIYHCELGYKSEEENLYLTCNASGLWEGPAFACEPVECPEHPNISHAENYKTNGTKFGDSASFSCSKGYINAGPEFVVCTETGQWTENYHACLPVECQEPQEPEHGSVEYNSTVYTSTVVYSCLPGYVIAGNATSECLDSGLWSAKAPKCSAVDCATPPLIQHGTVSHTYTTYKHLAYYSCNTGFILNGSDTLVCAENASWTGVIPYCTVVTCEAPVRQPHSQVVFTDLTYQAIATYICERGFKLVGEPSVSCTENGTWSRDPPECIPLDCSHPVQIKHGQVNVSGSTFGASATYSCDKGYVIDGSSVIFCGADGAWNSSAPTCKIVDCKIPPKIKNGIVLFNATLYSSVATYLCDEGYRLTGANAIICRENGLWESEIKLSCELITCPKPPSVPNGQVTFKELKYGSKAFYTCHKGYTLSGSSVTHCGSNGEWDQNPPTCDEPKCPALVDIPNGFVKMSGSHAGADANFTCSTGYVIEGESRLVCLKNQSWSSAPPICKRISCAPPPVIANAIIIADTGRNISSEVTYSCIKGYQMVNNKNNELSIICQDDGDWFGKIPSCEIVVCYELPPLIPNSTYVTTGDTYTSEAVYTCSPGYTLSGSPVMKCSHEGLWSTDNPPKCSPISCGAPPRFDKSSYNDTDFTFGQSVSYICDPGHDLIGTSVSICQLHGKWSPVTFECKVRHCDPIIEVPQNGKIITKDDTGLYAVGSLIEFACQEQFTLVGSRSIRCSESGEWDSRAPQCIYVIDLCFETLQVDNVLPPPPGKVTGDEIIVRCQTGYVSKGDMRSVCLPDNTWSLPQGRCERVSCGKPVVANVQNTVVLGKSYNYGDSVTFLCRYGYVPVNKPILTCLETGEWDGKPECTAHCKHECLNGGFCTGLNRCKCMPGWAGNRCQTAVCILPCLHGGHCVAPYKCGCPKGYQGSRCEHAICAKPCEKGGRCLRPNRCQCPFGVHGAFCDRSLPEHNRIT